MSPRRRWRPQLSWPRPEAALRDFVLKAQLVEFFAWLDTLGDGVIERLEVQHGLPFRIVVEEAAA
jgi:hypothetical protein